MNVKLPSLSMLSSKISNIIPSMFNSTADIPPMANNGDVDQLARWVKREKFMNFSGMEVAVPPGLNVQMMEFVSVLEHVNDVLKDFVDDVLKPVDVVLSAISHEPETLAIPSNWKFAKVKYPMRHIDPKDLVSKISACFGTAVLDTRPVEKVYRSAGEIEAVYERLAVLKQNLATRNRRDVSRIVESIGASTDIILEQNIHPTNAKELSLMLDTTSEWINLYGLYMKQVSDAEQAVEIMVAKLKKMQEGKK